MAKSVLVLNNPSSISILFSDLSARVDEVWIERGATEKLDRGIGRAMRVLGIDRELPICEKNTRNLFSAGRQSRGKVGSYRSIAAEIDDRCRSEGVTELICSSTSAFRLARVPRLHVVDHGTGDYLRDPTQTFLERLKYAWLYSGPAWRAFRYYAFLPLSGRIHLPLNADQIRDRIGGLNHPFARDHVSVILLIHPKRTLEDQLRRLHNTMGSTPYDVYLKGHHFDSRDISLEDQTNAGRPMPRILPAHLEVLPAEFLVWGFDAPLRLAAFESTALWNIGASAPDRIISLAQRSEIIALREPYTSGLATLEADLGYSPFL